MPAQSRRAVNQGRFNAYQGAVVAKRALLVGINTYANSSFNLRGCVNDVDSLRSVLQDKYGFDGSAIATLKDGEATGAAILRELEALFSEAAPGDTLVFGYAGHGTRYTDPKDASAVEAIVPHETTTTAHLVSNAAINAVVRACMSKRGLAGNANFTAIYDCCHSGLMYRDLVVNQTGELETGIINRVIDVSRLFAPPKILMRDIALTDDFQVLSACRDDQTAADLSQRPQQGIDRPRGAFSFVLHDMLRQQPSITLGELESRIADPIAALVAPHVQMPVMATRPGWKDKGIFTV